MLAPGLILAAVIALIMAMSQHGIPVSIGILIAALIAIVVGAFFAEK